MKSRRFLLIVGFLLVVIILIIAATALLIPQSDPAYAAAIDFVNAAGTGDDAEAMTHLSPELQTYVADNCPDGSVSACVTSYAPEDWGTFRSAVYRRSVPDGERAWDVDLIGTYESGVGASGVCIYTHVEQANDNNWYVTEWAGWLHCGDPASRNMATNPDTPNRAP
ncbi:MAG: hypothetical protein K8L99_23945 [Anaerolineae bacterium]|nr:hypothetical protein [Anaerolineae bacterium]